MGAAIQSSANLKAAIINQLKADILHLQGFKSLQATSHNFIELGPLESAFLILFSLLGLFMNL